jgi:hypothetical protein
MKKIKKLGTPNVDSKDTYKKFTFETEEEYNNCPCWVCKERIDIMRNIQRENSLLGNIISFHISWWF